MRTGSCKASLFTKVLINTIPTGRWRPDGARRSKLNPARLCLPVHSRYSNTSQYQQHEQERARQGKSTACLPRGTAEGPLWQSRSCLTVTTILSHATHIQVIDFRSFGERPAKGLATSLYIGSKADAKAEKTLRERGVKFVLNCTPTRK